MKAVRVVVMTYSAITFPLVGSGKRCTVVLNRKCCIWNISILCKVTNANTQKDKKWGDNTGHFIFFFFMMKKSERYNDSSTTSAVTS